MSFPWTNVKNRIFILTGWKEVSVASMFAESEVEKTSIVETLASEESVSKIAFSTEKHKLFLATNQNRVIQISATTLKVEQIIDLQSKKGPELFEVISNGEKLVIKGILKATAGILEEIEGLNFKHKKAAAFGSYGWGGESIPKLNHLLEKSGFSLVHPGLTCQWQPDAAGKKKCIEFGVEISKDQ